MEILDGKNRGPYKEFLIGQVVEYLNGRGRYWGRIHHPVVAKNYDSGELRSADVVFCATLRALVDRWIDSGIDERGVERPSGRNLEGVPTGHAEPLIQILGGWLSRHAPLPSLNRNGTIAIVPQQPSYHGLTTEAYAREMAIYYFKELLAVPSPHRLGRCANPHCVAPYFVRKRERNKAIKRSTYCGSCRLKGGAERTRLSRESKKRDQLRIAANAWVMWKPSHRYGKQSHWVAVQVNKACGTAITSKWVNQNLKSILKFVEDRDAESETAGRRISAQKS
jgi:hypothetical protein